MEINQVTLTVDVSRPEIAQAVSNLIGLMAGAQVQSAKTPTVTVPKPPRGKAAANKPAAKKEEPKAEEQEAETVWTLDELKVRVPALVKGQTYSEDADNDLRAKLAKIGVGNINALTPEQILDFGAFVEVTEKKYGAK